MNKSSHPIHAAMLALSREELRGVEHPSTGRILAYHRGELTAVEAAALTEHLSLCETCAEAALDAAEFFAEDDEEDAAPAELEAAWQKFRAASVPTAAPEISLPPPQRLPPPAQPQRSFLRSVAFAYGVAAVFAALSVGLTLFKVSPKARPEVNAGFFDLTPAGADRGETPPTTPIRFASPGSSALVLLNPAVVPSSQGYGVRIRQADGVEVWKSEDLVLQASGVFRLSLPAGAFPVGRYALELYGITHGRETPLGTYWIAIEK